MVAIADCFIQCKSPLGGLQSSVGPFDTRTRNRIKDGHSNLISRQWNHNRYIGETGAIWQGFLFLNFLGKSKKQKKF